MRKRTFMQNKGVGLFNLLFDRQAPFSSGLAVGLLAAGTAPSVLAGAYLTQPEPSPLVDALSRDELRLQEDKNRVSAVLLPVARVSGKEKRKKLAALVRLIAYGQRRKH